MTRSTEIDLEDLLDCLHAPEVPVVDESSGDVVAWRCRCGEALHPPPARDPAHA